MGVVVGVNSPVGVGVSVGCGSSSVGDWPFWGSDSVRTIKSFALLSVSSLLPNKCSIPPRIMEARVEVGDAFLSILPFAEGVAAGLVSTSVAVPNPTLSTSVVPASL